MSEYITKEQVNDVFEKQCAFSIGNAFASVVAKTWESIANTINALPAQPVIPLNTVIRDGSGLYFMLYWQDGCLKGIYGNTPEDVTNERNRIEQHRNQNSGQAES